MAEPTEKRPALKQVVIGVHPNIKLEEIVQEVESVFKLMGCSGCLSGLERFVFEQDLSRTR
jgi:hypothetical protein